MARIPRKRCKKGALPPKTTKCKGVRPLFCIPENRPVLRHPQRHSSFLPVARTLLEKCGILPPVRGVPTSPLQRECPALELSPVRRVISRREPVQFWITHRTTAASPGFLFLSN